MEKPTQLRLAFHGAVKLNLSQIQRYREYVPCYSQSLHHLILPFAQCVAKKLHLQQSRSAKPYCHQSVRQHCCHSHLLPEYFESDQVISKGSIGKLRHVQASFAYHNLDATNMRNMVELGGGVIPDIAVYPVVGTRFATGAEPVRLHSTVVFDPKFKTDCYATIQACLLYTSPSPRDGLLSRMPSSA